MRRYYLISIIFLFLTSQNFPQIYLDYFFIPTEYGTYTEITGGTISTATGNDGAENITLPFPFEYMGITYTTARISVNGWLEMGQTYTGLGYENELESTVKKPLICPLWDDLYADSQSEIRYETIGEYPARIFVVQWKNIQLYGGGRKSFQIRLWEIDGTIDFIYGPGTGSVFNSFSVGLNNHIGGAGNFISVTIEDQYYYTVDTMIANNGNEDVSLLNDGMLLSFVPDVYTFTNKLAKIYQTPDSVIVGNPNQKIFAIIIPCHAGGVMTPPWVTKFNFNTNGTTNTEDIVNAKLFYTGSSPQFSTQIQLGGTFHNPNGLFEITGGTYLNNNGLSYFWLAYDISPNAIVGNLVDGNCYRIDAEGCCPSIFPDSSLATSNCIIIDNTLPTTINIGIGGDFISITEALQTLQNQSITSPHILELLSTYEMSNESFPIEIPFIEGSSQTNTITIRPSISATDIELSSDTTVILFHNSTYTTIDGRPGGIIEENQISFINTSTNSSTVLFYEGAQFDSIKYCNVYGCDTTVNGGVVLFSSTSYTNSNNTLANCLITNTGNYIPTNGIRIFNLNSGGGSHHKIENCQIKNFTRAGIEIHSADNSLLIGNVIHNEIPVQSSLLYGINNYGKYISISRCKIYDLITDLPNSNEIFGINIPRAHGGIISNNFISLAGNQYSTISGIYSYGELFSENYYFYYNSVYIYGINSNSLNSYCFKRHYLYPVTYDWYFRNNILINKRINSSGNGIHLAIAINDPDNVGSLDYNNYYVDSLNNFLGQWNNSYVSTIQQWQSISNRDSNSVSEDVNFVSNTDLHLTGSSIGDPDLIGTPIPNILIDIDGEPRDLLFPYKGADEVDTPVSIYNKTFLPKMYFISQNYPNPFNNSTVIKYSIPQEGLATLKVYNLLGEEVAKLVNDTKQTGNYEVSFEATGLPSGIYFYRLQAGSFVQTKKMVLMK